MTYKELRSELNVTRKRLKALKKDKVGKDSEELKATKGRIRFLKDKKKEHPRTMYLLLIRILSIVSASWLILIAVQGAI